MRIIQISQLLPDFIAQSTDPAIIDVINSTHFTNFKLTSRTISSPIQNYSEICLTPGTIFFVLRFEFVFGETVLFDLVQFLSQRTKIKKTRKFT
jgi:hypothetical protein